MTDQAQSSAAGHLVDLYAGRVQARYRRPGGPRVSHRQRAGIHRFGRRPGSTFTFARRGKGAFAAVMATAVLAGATPGIASASSSYEIRHGDTLSGIAGRHGMSVENLAHINGIEDPDHILAGEMLNLDEQSDGPDVGDTVYRIKSGDTLFEIARNHDVSLADLLEVNAIENPDLIFVDDVLIIPTGSGLAAADESHDGADTEQPDSQVQDHVDDEVASMHLVGNGETLLAIADRYGVPMELLAQFNDISDVNVITTGSLLKIPSNSAVSGFWERERQHTLDPESTSTATTLEGVPALQQSLSLSCESAAASMATAYWGYQVSEWVFIENMPYHANPHRGFRGDMNGPFGGTDDYGVYAKPIASILANYGYSGDEFYSMGDPEPLKNWIDRGVPVIVWMSNMASDQDRFYEWHEGERFTLVPQQHVVVAYGYDDTGVHVADPGDGQHRVFGWEDFLRSWSYFDGMSLAVYPKG